MTEEQRKRLREAVAELEAAMNSVQGYNFDLGLDTTPVFEVSDRKGIRLLHRLRLRAYCEEDIN